MRSLPGLPPSFRQRHRSDNHLFDRQHNRIRSEIIRTINKRVHNQDVYDQRMKDPDQYRYNKDELSKINLCMFIFRFSVPRIFLPYALL